MGLKATILSYRTVLYICCMSYSLIYYETMQHSLSSTLNNMLCNT